MHTVEQLRQVMRDQAFILRQFKHNRQAIVDFDEGLFWGCVPQLLKNFIGLLTLSEQQFGSMKENHGYFDLFDKDLFNESHKKVRIASLSYDILNLQDEKAITPKHLLFGNELFHHTRSANLLKISNRLGHSCGYDTIRRLHREAAEDAIRSSDPMKLSRQRKTHSRHDFIVKVADNFDHNPDSTHGNADSIHILNQILVSTSENDETPFIVKRVLDELVNDVVKSIDPTSVRTQFKTVSLVQQKSRHRTYFLSLYLGQSHSRCGCIVLVDSSFVHCRYIQSIHRSLVRKHSHRIRTCKSLGHHARSLLISTALRLFRHVFTITPTTVAHRGFSHSD